MVLERLALVLLLALVWPAVSQAEDDRAFRCPLIDQAAERAVQWLVKRQAADGAWRSESYGPLRNGPELTPRVARSLSLLAPRNAQASRAAGRAVNYLDGLVEPQGGLGLEAFEYPYPVYSSADALTLLIARRPPGLEPGRHRLVIRAFQADLRCHQFTAARGWRPEDDTFGGWGYAPLPLSRPDVVPRDFPGGNLSATVFALEALGQADLPAETGWLQAARQFVFRCQNYTAPGADAAFDDGGFFFSPVDMQRNKAGGGRDAQGRQRYYSYGSMTSDGLFGLRLCGLAPTDARLTAARRWLEQHFSPHTHPGRFAPERDDLREAYYFYYAFSLGRAWAADVPVTSEHAQRQQQQAAALAAELVRRQLSQGAWRNELGDGKEDDPLVATALALAALENCRAVLSRGQHRRPTAVE